MLVPAVGGVAARRTLEGRQLLPGAAESEMGAEAPPYWKVLQVGLCWGCCYKQP